MKKILLFIILFFGIMPHLHKHKIKISTLTSLHAQDDGGEGGDDGGDGGDGGDGDGDGDGDDGDDDPPCDSYFYYVGSELAYSEGCYDYYVDGYDSGDCNGDDGITYTDPYPVASAQLNGVGLDISSSSGNVGDYVTLTADASVVGDPDLSYKFEVYEPDEGWTTIGNAGSPSSTTYQIDESGDTQFRVTVTSSCDGSQVQDTNDFEADNSCGISNVSISISSIAGGSEIVSGSYGDDVVLTAHVTLNGTPNVLYKFQVKDDDNWVDLNSPSSNVNYSYHIDEEVTSFRVVVTDDCTPPDNLTSGSAIFSATNCRVTKAILGLSASTGNYHDVVRLTASSIVKGTPTVLYEFQILNNGNWTDLAPPSTDLFYDYTIDEAVTNFRVLAVGTCGATTKSTPSNVMTYLINNDASVAIQSDQVGGKPLDNNTTTANLTSQNLANFTNVRYTYKIFFNRTWFDLTDTPVPENTYVYTAKALGQMSFQVMVDYDFGGTHYQINSNQVDYLVDYCQDDFKTQYLSDFNEAWESTKNSSIASYQANQANSSQPVLKYEYGFYVNFDGSNLSKLPLPVATSQCSVPFTGGSSISYEPRAADPTQPGVIFTIAKFHTHPPLTYCPSNISLVPGPSQSPYDLGTPFPSFPMVVRTYSTTETGGQNINDAFTDTSYGNTCTQYFLF